MAILSLSLQSIQTTPHHIHLPPPLQLNYSRFILYVVTNSCGGSRHRDHHRENQREKRKKRKKIVERKPRQPCGTYCNPDQQQPTHHHGS